MSLFEIDLNKDFKIVHSSVFLNNNDFQKYFQKNSLNNDFNDKFENYVEEEYFLTIHQDFFVTSRYRYEVDEIFAVINENIYYKNKDSKEIVLYPEWLLFYIAMEKKYIVNIPKQEFLDYLKKFKYISEIRYKKYIIRNLEDYLNIKELANLKSYKEKLNNQFLLFLKRTKFETKVLYNFLNFIYKFHHELKNKEKYKLMWNIEVYIIETINLLITNGILVEEIYLEIFKNRRGTYSVLHDIYKYKPLYIKESKNSFKSHLVKINNIFKIQLTLDKFIETLTLNKKYEDILFSYLELIKRFNANKMSEDVMSAMIKGIVLGLEEYIKYDIKENTFDKCLEKLSIDKVLFQNIRIKQKEYDDGNELLDLINNLTKKEESLEKYLAIYYSARNYLAHYNLNMDKFFWGDDGERLIVSNVIDSVLIILYKIEINKQEDEK